MSKLSLRKVSLQGKRVLVRVDFNVPLDSSDGGSVQVADDTRIQAALPTIRYIIEAGGRAVLVSHLGRPKGTSNPQFSLHPVALHLESLLGTPVRFVGNTIGETVEDAVNELPNGGVVLLENTRFLGGETKNDVDLAKSLSRIADVYINDAFGTAHRAHASTEGVTHFVDQAAMGFLVEREVNYLTNVLEAPEAPFVAILGGAKVSDKIGVIRNLLDKVDHLLIGGAMSYTFLKALGNSVGSSRVEEDKLAEAKALFEEAQGKILLPVDHVVATAFDNHAPHRTVHGEIASGEMGLDIGPETIALYKEKLLSAKTVVWNGPMGVFEMPNYAQGTLAMADTLATATKNGCMTVVGGGDSVAAITQSGYADAVSHVSTGGGAMLEFLEGKILPGIAALTDQD